MLILGTASHVFSRLRILNLWYPHVVYQFHAVWVKDVPFTGLIHILTPRNIIYQIEKLEPEIEMFSLDVDSSGGNPLRSKIHRTLFQSAEPAKNASHQKGSVSFERDEKF